MRRHKSKEEKKRHYVPDDLAGLDQQTDPDWDNFMKKLNYEAAFLASLELIIRFGLANDQEKHALIEQLATTIVDGQPTPDENISKSSGIGPMRSSHNRTERAKTPYPTVFSRKNTCKNGEPPNLPTNSRSIGN